MNPPMLLETAFKDLALRVKELQDEVRSLTETVDIMAENALAQHNVIVRLSTKIDRLDGFNNPIGG